MSGISVRDKVIPSGNIADFKSLIRRTLKCGFLHGAAPASGMSERVRDRRQAFRSDLDLRFLRRTVLAGFLYIKERARLIPSL